MNMNQVKANHQLARARRDNLVVQEMPDEILVYDLKQHEAHVLNQTAAFVWNHCDGQTTAAEIATLIEKEWHKPVSEDVVWLALKQLSRANLLQEPIAMPDNGTRISRRNAMRKLGLAAAMIPVVMSIVAPTALAGASIPPACQSCVKKIAGPADCPNVCVNVTGQCFDNSGCGAGSALVCQTCGTCSQNHGQTTTVSWVAPGGC